MIKINCLNKLTKIMFRNLRVYFSSSVSFRSLSRGAETAVLRPRGQIFARGCGLKSSTGGPLMELNIFNCQTNRQFRYR